MLTKNFQMYNLGLEKAKEPEIKLPTFIGSQEFKKNIYSCFIDYGKVFDCMDHNKLWKILKEKRDGNTRPSYLPLEKSVCRSRRNS